METEPPAPIDTGSEPDPAFACRLGGRLALPPSSDSTGVPHGPVERIRQDRHHLNARSHGHGTPRHPGNQARSGKAGAARVSSHARAGQAKAESLIAPDITIEGKIEGAGHVRIAGSFKGDVNVRGDLTIEPGAKVTGSVRAEKVTIAGELIGNIESAAHVELLQTGALTGDLKAGIAQRGGGFAHARPGRVRLGR